MPPALLVHLALLLALLLVVPAAAPALAPLLASGAARPAPRCACTADRQVPLPAREPCRFEPLPRTAPPERLVPAPAAEEEAEARPLFPPAAACVPPPAEAAAAELAAAPFVLPAGAALLEEARPCCPLMPEYPHSCRRLGHEGEVTLQVQVGADGRARLVEVLEGDCCPLLVESALAAARAADYEGTSAWGRLCFRFRLTDEALALAGY